MVTTDAGRATSSNGHGIVLHDASPDLQRIPLRDLQERADKAGAAGA